MKLIASIHAYDVLSNVQVTALCRQYPDYEDGPGDVALRVSVLVPGEGIDDPQAWLRDVLVALIEAI
jgi:hypothetical protein